LAKGMDSVSGETIVSSLGTEIKNSYDL
jgi:hypothetical protein